jgi:hypothetical protein
MSVESRSPLRRRVGSLAAEFMVIVVGVLVALAVDQWREDQADAGLRSFYLSALEADLVSDSAAIEDAVARAGLVRRTSAELEELIPSQDAPRDEGAFLRAITSLLSNITFVSNSTTVQDITSSGNLRLLENPELRNRLLRYALYVRTRSDAIETNGSNVGRHTFPAAFLEPPIFVGLRERLETSIPNQQPLTNLMNSSAVLGALRSGGAEVTTRSRPSSKKRRASRARRTRTWSSRSGRRMSFSSAAGDRPRVANQSMWARPHGR